MADGDDSPTPAVPDPGDESESVETATPAEAAEAGPPPADGAEQRDWDAEWKTITADLAPRRGAYLRSDLPQVGAGQGPRDYSPQEDPDADHYIPDPPARQTGMSTRNRIAWACLAAGPVLLLLALFAFESAPPWYVGTALALFLTGCVLGFLRLPTDKSDRDDDGAAV